MHIQSWQNQVYYSVASELSVFSLCRIISRITFRKAINLLYAGLIGETQDTPCKCNLVGKKSGSNQPNFSKIGPQCLHVFLARSIGNYLCIATCYAAQTSVVLLYFVAAFTIYHNAKYKF